MPGRGQPSRDGPATTASLRTLGTGALQAAAGNHTHAGGAGTGDVVGPAGATDSHVALFDGPTGKLVKSAGTTLAAAIAAALAAFTGSSAIVTLGTIVTGVWSGTAIAVAKLGSGTPSAGKYLDGGGSWATLNATAVGLGSVENAAASALYVPITRPLAPSSRPSGTTTPAAYAQVVLYDDPLVIASGDLYDLTSAGALVWLDSTAWRSVQVYQSLHQPTSDQTLVQGTTVHLVEDPLILDSGRLAIVPLDSVLWLDAARAPVQLPSLVWIVR